MVSAEEFEQQMIEEMEGIQLDQQQDDQDEQALNSQEFNEGMMVPEPEQTFNQHQFIAESLNIQNPEKVTYLDVSELGRPIFNMRFLLDIEDVCKHYLDDLCKEHKQSNKIAEYFRAKIKNISDSGLSKDGFIQNINVTRKMDVTRRRQRNIENLKGGNQQK